MVPNSRIPPPPDWGINFEDYPTVSGSETTAAPDQAGVQQILAQNAGFCVDCEFLVGSTLICRRGILVTAGENYVVIYEVPQARYVVCDFNSLRFVNFYEPGREPC
jgi:hypothetical protein